MVAMLSACRHVDTVYIDPLDAIPAEGLYLLCEGNMGSNKATIDFYDVKRDTLYRNIYPAINPSVVMALGDVGNDIAIYGSKMYAVINCSGKVEVMDRDARRITQINIPNCRNIVFADGYAFVTSYAGPVMMDENYSQRGYVAKIDTASLTVVATCTVGFQPNGLVVYHGYLYVANSGGYMAPRFDSTVSVVRIHDMHEVERITVAPNLDAICLDVDGEALYVSSLGDYMEHKAALFRVDLQSRKVSQMPCSASKMCLVGDSLFYYSYDYIDASFGVLHLPTGKVSPLSLERYPKVPYGIWIDPATHDRYLTDSPSYVNPGYLYRYTNDGRLVSTHRTGDIPGHFCRR